jgi:hypothetical protein
MRPSESRRIPALSRRSFAKLGAGAVAGLSAAGGSGARPARETLALNGGARAVRVPAERLAAVTKWPRYGDAEKQAVAALLESNKFYDEIAPLEEACRDYHRVPYAKAHCNGTSALMSMFFALDLPPGSEIFVPS